VSFFCTIPGRTEIYALHIGGSVRCV